MRIAASLAACLPAVSAAASGQRELSPDDLPVDAHELIALAAPRRIFIGAGTVERGDGWVDARGSFEAARAASPADELLNVRGLVGGTTPPSAKSETGGGSLSASNRTGTAMRSTGHICSIFAALRSGLSK